MARYARELMTAWSPAVAFPAADYDTVARDIGDVSKTPHDVAVLAGLAYFEGARFAAYVDELLCNDAAWRSRCLKPARAPAA